MCGGNATQSLSQVSENDLYATRNLLPPPLFSKTHYPRIPPLYSNGKNAGVRFSVIRPRTLIYKCSAHTMCGGNVTQSLSHELTR